ncbi:YpmS family protein [Metabacillus iocasae]|uniref:Uncharacterized protein YpmS n=1 Tax=Priestia iocasae TaxID=2291674 RepID=A0ABS2QUP3_9BACI|nr:YpmS family protein [Metabacillus iocasae]MBM7703196.1 uncharacterized protein YpmS [Metabacillus iocasae]
MKKWKVLFIGLLSVNIVVALILVSIIFMPANDVNFNDSSKIEGNAELTLLAKKEDLNTLIDKYLKKEFNNQPLNYQVRLTDVVEVNGTIQAFGNDLDIQMSFEPVVQENGDILLEQQTLSVGKLQLPVRTVLRYVNNNFKLPKYVQIDPNNESVYVALQQLELKSDFRAKVQKFDLENDDIRVKLVSTQ